MNKRELYQALRYQVLTPPVTTMGPCAKGCGSSARGSAVCKWCLAKELDKVTNRWASIWVREMDWANGTLALLEEVLREG